MAGPERRNPIREEIQRLRTAGGVDASAQVRKVRAQAVADQFASLTSMGNPFVARNRDGQVKLARVEYREMDDDVACVEVWVGDSDIGPPHYRFFNPPTLARDPEGDINIEGQRYREDPLAAIVEVILGSKR